MWSVGKISIIFFWPNFAKNYMFKIFFMVALGNFVTFSQNLSKFSGRDEEGGVGWGWPFWQTFQKFPLFWGGLQNISAEDDENWEIRTDLGEGSVTYMRVLSKN